MPRGGRRPGAGAPKGNLNGFRNGNHCRRAALVCAALLAHPDPRAVAIALRDRGFLRPPASGVPGPANPYVFNRRNTAALVAFLYPRLFDCPHPGAIKPNQTQSEIDAPTPRIDAAPASPRPATPPPPPEIAPEKKMQNAIKRRPTPNLCLHCAIAARAQRANDNTEPQSS